MDDIQQLILDTYKEKPKHFTQILKRNTEVIKYIKLNVPKEISEFLEQIYYVVYQENALCINGNRKKLKTFSGYSFCGKAGFDQSKTEFEIMDEQGFLRIWDCGTRTWVLNCVEDTLLA